MTIPNPLYPGVPTPDQDIVDRGRITERTLSEIRKALAGLTRVTDGAGNAAMLTDAVWGVSLPQLHTPAYPLVPYLGAAGYTFTVASVMTFKPMARQFNVGVRWGFLEVPTTGTGIGEFELRYNAGMVPLPRGTGTGFSTAVDTWNSGTAGTKGQDGALMRAMTFELPAGPVFNDPAGVTFSLWTRTRSATGTANDLARVAPMWAFQSGVGKG